MSDRGASKHGGADLEPERAHSSGGQPADGRLALHDRPAMAAATGRLNAPCPSSLGRLVQRAPRPQMRGAEAETTIDQGSGAAFVDFNGSSL
jgi:hypothetical protein